MGASLTFYTFESQAFDVKSYAKSLIEQDAIDKGSDTYSGGIGQKSGVAILNKVFSSKDEFEEYCEKSGCGSKWDENVYVAEICRSTGDPLQTQAKKPQSLIALERQYAEVQGRLESFESDILVTIKGQVSKTKSCKSCGKRHEISEMTSLRCSKCRCIILTDTQKAEKARLLAKAKDLKSRIESVNSKAVTKQKDSSVTEVELKKQLEQAIKVYEGFDASILSLVKKSKSKTKSCKYCNTRFYVRGLKLEYKYLGQSGSGFELDKPNDFACSQCGFSFLTETQRKKKSALENEIESIKSKLKSVAKVRTYALFARCAS